MEDGTAGSRREQLTRVRFLVKNVGFSLVGRLSPLAVALVCIPLLIAGVR